MPIVAFVVKAAQINAPDGNVDHSLVHDRVLAIDIPSGLDCDTGAVAGVAIVAAHTCTFVAAKRGFMTEGAARYVGQVHVLDIGAPRILVDEVLASDGE